LAKHYKIYLGAFIDSNDDWQYVDKLNDFCESIHFSKLTPSTATFKSILGLLKGEPLTLPYYRDRGMQSWVDKVLENESISNVLIYSSAMAQYVSNDRHKSLCRVIDFVDIDSDKWRQYAEKKTWPMSWIYKRESKCLEKFERNIATKFDFSYFVSKSEADMFKKLAPECGNKIRYFNNGVDTDYFTPENEYQNPYQEQEKIILFTGAMDYWANIDAVCWFAREVLPLITKKSPVTRFYIVGSNPTDQVKSLENESIVVTGAVKDIRPFIANAHIIVAPLRIARGIQNKVLEAMAMAKPVITTTQAYEGIKIFDQFGGAICDEPEAMANYCLDKLNDEDLDKIGKENRKFVINNYNWDSNINLLSRSLNP
jgi:sugar transferase (PEP-CTERM/EpsH1 system associated)